MKYEGPMNSPIEPPEGKLIRELLEQISKALVHVRKDPIGAEIELEYAQTITDDVLTEHPEMKAHVFYRTPLNHACRNHGPELYSVLKKMLCTAEEIDTIGTITDAQFAEGMALLNKIEGRE